MRDELIKQLRRDEGEILHAYEDHLGYLTIGVGRLIDHRKGGGISEEESAYLLNNDITQKTKDVLYNIPWAKDLGDARMGVLINMAFQLGINGLLGFKTTLRMVREGQYDKAADNMLLSLWAKQTPGRAQRLAKQMRTGEWQ